MIGLFIMYYLWALFVVYVVSDIMAAGAYIEFLEKRRELRMDRTFNQLENIITIVNRLKSCK